ncbi:hypothetical protein GCM10027406_32030 [Leifsonia lichenia]
MRRRELRGQSARRSRRERPGDAAEQLAELVDELVTLMEAGVRQGAAWGYVREFSAHPLAGRVAGRIAAGESIADALARAAGATGVAGAAGAAGAAQGRTAVSGPGRAVAAGPRPPVDSSWAVLAAVWQVAEAAGAPMSPTLRRLADSLRDRAETERDVQVALAGPSATARLVSWLPAVGMTLAVVMGVDPVGTLTGSVIGWVILAAGVLLLLLGRRWMRALRRRAHPGADVPGLRHDLVATALSGGLGAPGAQSLCDEVCAGLDVAEGERTEVARILSLAQRAGAPAVELLRSGAAQAGRRRRTQGRSDAAALAVRSMVPLGVCVLPSFMLLGVAPVVLSIVSSTIAAF